MAQHRAHHGTASRAPWHSIARTMAQHCAHCRAHQNTASSWICHFVSICAVVMSHLKAAPFVNESTTVSSSSLTSHGPNNSTLTVLPLTPSIIKVTYLPDITRRDPATYAVLPLDSPAHTLTPPTGTPRAAIVPSEATPPNPTITKDTLETSHLKIHLTPAGLLFHTPTADLICSDASSGAYSATAIPNGPVTHRQTMARRGHQPTHTEHFYGAGDSPGRVDRYGTNVKVREQH